MTIYETACLHNAALRAARNEMRRASEKALRKQPTDMEVVGQAMIDVGAAIMMSEDRQEAAIYLYRLSRKVRCGQSFDF